MGILVNGTENADTLEGSDTLTAMENKDDTLNGMEGDDDLFGGFGNDSLYGGDGHDAVDGGDGNDVIYFTAGHGFDQVYGGLGNDTLNATAATDAGIYDFAAGTISGFGGGELANIENFLGSNWTGDTVISDGSGVYYGQGGNDVMTANIGGEESLYGGLGTDTLITTLYGGNYVINLATGATNFAGESFVGFEYLTTGAGNDSLTGSTFNNLIDAGTGNDSLFGGTGDDTLIGGEGNDSLVGSTGLDSMSGGIGNDTLVGGTSVDTIFGGTGDDLIRINGVDFFDVVDGGGGRDTVDASQSTVAGVFDFVTGVFSGNGVGAVSSIEVFLGSTTLGDTILTNGSGKYLGQGGNDTMTAAAGGAETLDGGAGVDTLYALDGNQTVNLATGVTGTVGERFLKFENLITGAGADSLTGSTAANTIEAGGGDDVVSGQKGNDKLFGLEGNDTLLGGEGTDRLVGAGGADVLEGEVGNDTMIGGNGNDRFVFAVGFGSDQIGDFVAGVGVGDVLDFRPLGIAIGDLTFTSAAGGTATRVTVTGTADVVLLTGVAFGSLVADDFLF